MWSAFEHVGKICLFVSFRTIEITYTFFSNILEIHFLSLYVNRIEHCASVPLKSTLQDKKVYWTRWLIIEYTLDYWNNLSFIIWSGRSLNKRTCFYLRYSQKLGLHNNFHREIPETVWICAFRRRVPCMKINSEQNINCLPYSELYIYIIHRSFKFVLWYIQSLWWDFISKQLE